MLRAMLELYLIRHGQTDFSRENRFCGSIDPPLNDVGPAHGGGVRRRVREARRGTAIYVLAEPARAPDGGAARDARRASTPMLDEGLREIAYGEWESLRHEEAKAKWPEIYAYWAADTASRGTPGGETAFMVAARAAPVIERIRREHPEGRVLVVSHKATIRILVCALLGLDVRLFRDRIGQGVAAVSRFEMKKTGPMLTMLGDVSHLPPDLRELEGT